VIELRIPSPVQEVADERLRGSGVRLLVKRDDLIHPDFPGNKWRKLKHNLAAAAAQGATRLLTFGGAYSNHILATAAAGHHYGFATVGVIRGEVHPGLNPVLAAAVDHGMTLSYFDRGAYRAKTTPAVLDQLRAQFGDFYLIPEGGANAPALRGCAELVAEIVEPFDVLCCAAGTGATLAGVATALRPGQRALGFAVLKGGAFLADEVTRLQRDFGSVTGNWSIETEFHFGGYARTTPGLHVFAEDFHSRHGITLDPRYEAKMMSGLFTLQSRARFPPGTTVLALLA
jgi:1-aminocyclopropane-1-carboxylate deaminase